MRIQTEEWRRFIPGCRMYKGKKTLFYNGEILWNEIDIVHPFLMYDWEERQSWEVIIILPGVEIIPESTFFSCRNVKTVIIADTVKRIEWSTFSNCKSLEYVRFSLNIEFIGSSAFVGCKSLTSMFIPQSCQEISNRAFEKCTKLIILSVPYHTRLGINVIYLTALSKVCRIKYSEGINDWIHNHHIDMQFALHRVSSSSCPILEEMHAIVKQQGLAAFTKPDSIGVTPSKYLALNPFVELKEQEIIKRYINEMMGEAVQIN